MPGSVLTALIASAPALAMRLAMPRTSVAAGESLTISGRSVAPRTAAVELARSDRVERELEAAGTHVGARDVELDAGHAGLPIEPSRDLDVIGDRFAGDIDDDRHLPCRPGRGVLFEHGVDARVLEADRVEHPGRRLGHARRRVADTRPERRAFRADRAEAVDVDDVAVLDAIAERARRDQDRVGQHKTAAQVDAQIDRPEGRGVRRCRGHDQSATRSAPRNMPRP